MAGFASKAWQPSPRPRGSVHVDWMAGFLWIEWQLSHELGGRHPWNMHLAARLFRDHEIRE